RLLNKPLPPVPTRPSDFQKSISLVNTNVLNNKSNSPPIPPKKISTDQNVRRLQSLPTNLNYVKEQKQENTRNANSLYVSSSAPKVPPPVPPKRPTIQRIPLENIQKNQSNSETDSESGSSSSRSYQNESFSDVDSLNHDEIHHRRTNIVNEILST